MVLCNRVTNQYVAVKIVRSHPNYIAAAKEEIGLLRDIAKHDPDNQFCVCHLLESFELNGPNGIRLLLVVEWFWFDIFLWI
jgi:hypothetical protein